MYRDWYWPQRPRPANGIRAQSRSGSFGKTWWASKWIAALERLVDPARLSRGRAYARSGQVLELKIEPGRVRSRVQGSRAEPYTVRIEIKPLVQADWERVADAMAREAIFAAKLLAGEMPPDVEDAFISAGVTLFPAVSGDWETQCSCPDWANPCKHVAAVCYLLGEQFDADPFLLFRLRGKTRDEIMTMLRVRRTAPAAEQEVVRVVSVPTASPPPAEEAPRLDMLVDRFWESPMGLDEVAINIEHPLVDAVPVKRLGVPGFWQARGDILQTFGRLYRSVSDQCLRDAVGVKRPARGNRVSRGTRGRAGQQDMGTVT